MREIVKSKFYCKCGQQTSPRIKNATWKDQFVKGKIYDGEYETYSNSDGYRLNGGWSRYWVIDEMGEKVEVGRVRFKILFEELREHNLDSIIYEND